MNESDKKELLDYLKGLDVKKPVEKPEIPISKPPVIDEPDPIPSFNKDKMYAVRDSSIPSDVKEYIFSNFDNLTDYVRKSGSRDLDMSRRNIRNDLVQDGTQSVIMLGVGAIIFMYSLGVSNLLGFLISFLLGVFFIVYGLFNIYVKVFKKWRMSS